MTEMSQHSSQPPNQVLKPGSQELHLARAAIRGEKHLQRARLTAGITKLADDNKKLLEDIISRGLCGESLLATLKEQKISPNVAAAILYVCFNKTAPEVFDIFNCQSLPIRDKKLAGSFIARGIKMIASNLGISEQFELHSLWNPVEQEKCLELAGRIEKWAANPTNGKIPSEQIHLPLPSLIANLPWLKGRNDQLSIKFRELAKAAKQEEHELSASGTAIYAWVDVNPAGAIVLTVSMTPREEIKKDSTQRLARFVIGAAANRSSRHSADYTHASLFVSREEADLRLKQLYPAIPDRQRIFQEFLTMTAGGAFELDDFQQALHLKIAEKKFQTAAGTNVSRTAQLTLVSGLFLEVPERRGKNKGEPGKMVTRRCRLTIGLPSSILSGGARKCCISLTKDSMATAAKTGLFIGATFRLQTVDESQKPQRQEIGQLRFRSRPTGKMPVFSYESAGVEKTHRQISSWSQDARNWLLKQGLPQPQGGIEVPVIDSGKDKNRYCIIGKQKVTLSSLPQSISKMLAYCTTVKGAEKNLRLILLFSEHGEPEGCVYCTERENKKAIKALTKYFPRFVPKDQIYRDWSRIRDAARELWKNQQVDQLISAAQNESAVSDKNS